LTQASPQAVVSYCLLQQGNSACHRGECVKRLAFRLSMSCRAGLKLEAALDHFDVDVTGLRVLDSGLSTGGFADCLLQRGAAHVVGVDVGYGQVSSLAAITAHAELALTGLLSPALSSGLRACMQWQPLRDARCEWHVGLCKLSAVISGRWAFRLSKESICMHDLDCPFRI